MVLLVSAVVRAAPFALPGNMRKTECGAMLLLVRLVVRLWSASLRGYRNLEKGRLR